MSAEFAQELRNRRAQACDQIWYGKKATINLDENKSFNTPATIIVFVLFILPAFMFVFKFLFQSQIDKTRAAIIVLEKSSIIIALFFTILLIPYLTILWQAIKHWQWPSFHRWKSYTLTKKTIANIALAYLLTMAVNDTYTFAVNHNLITPLPLISTVSPTKTTFKTNLNGDQSNKKHEKYKRNESNGKSIHNHTKASATIDKIIELNNHASWVLWGILSLLLCIITTKLTKTDNSTQLADHKTNVQTIPFGLWLGESSGKLAELSHGVGMAPGQNVALFGDDAAQNILILGATGSGKTTRAVQPLLLQLLEQQCGGLIFDIKGDFQKTVSTLIQQIDSSYTAIGAAETPFNLLAGLTPEIASSSLKSVFLLTGGQRQDSFWMDTATELCRNVLGILSFLPESYSLHDLYCYLFDKQSLEEFQYDIARLYPKLDKERQRLLRSYQHYYKIIFSDFDEKVQAGVKATIAQVLAPFNHPELIDAFCKASPDSAHLEDVLDGQVFLVNMPLSRWGLGGKVIYTFIKLRFFNIMQRRVTQQEWNQDRFIFFLCDEYQEIVSANKDGLSDLNFWDKSRSSKTIGIISSQSVSSFYAAIGDRDMANALLQNFRQKICFRTEDETTIALMNRLLGTVEIQRVTNTQNSGRSSSGWQQSGSHSGQSTSISTHDRPLLDGQFFRTLPRDHALVLLSLWGNGCDDVLKMDALFLNPE